MQTAEMPGFYKDGEYDVAGFAVGSVKQDRVINGNSIQEGDKLMGLPSSGVHSNGFSLARRVLEVHLPTLQPSSSCFGDHGNSKRLQAVLSMLATQECITEGITDSWVTHSLIFSTKQHSPCSGDSCHDLMFPKTES